jgi:thiopeptide-type bacteriocin biosynthesis protein
MPTRPRPAHAPNPLHRTPEHTEPCHPAAVKAPKTLLHGTSASRPHPPDAWRQVSIDFTDPATAEHIGATRIAPLLRATDDIRDWWYIRKAPCWRLRYRPAPHAEPQSVHPRIRELLNDLASSAAVTGWRTGIYEPEILAFGGPAGMATAHELFHADSSAILDHLRTATDPARAPLRRRELAVLLAGTLLRAAGLDWYEQGDVWHRVEQMRPLAAATPEGRRHRLTADVRVLMNADTGPRGSLMGPGGLLSSAAPWAAAFDQAGRDLADAAGNGRLDRGLRAVCAHHLIFHFNRLGLGAGTQAALARAAREAVMGPTPVPAAPERRGEA